MGDGGYGKRVQRENNEGGSLGAQAEMSQFITSSYLLK